MSKIRVLIVDDSALVRRMAREVLAADPEIEVVGVAADPYEARDRIALLSPEVVTLDLEMPRMDGLTFLGLLMERRPLPVVVMSSLTQRGSDCAIEALRLGAVDVIGKPVGSFSFGQVGAELIRKVKLAARVRPRTRSVRSPGPATASMEPAAPAAPLFGFPRSERFDSRSIILLGASTGGVETLHEILSALPAEMPGIALVQHMPPVFSKSFAARLNQLCELDVREAADGDVLLPGRVLVAPGNFHMLLHRSGSQFVVRVVDGPKLWHQRPAVDVLFKSAADAGAGARCIAGVLTGMGRDGADGLLALHRRGATTFAQDEKTSIVYGMPRAAVENGAAATVLALDKVAPFLIRTCRTPAPALAPAGAALCKP
jgi:two-component system chemotaxis response regulator CheB